MVPQFVQNLAFIRRLFDHDLMGRRIVGQLSFGYIFRVIRWPYQIILPQIIFLHIILLPHIPMIAIHLLPHIVILLHILIPTVSARSYSVMIPEFYCSRWIF